MPVVLTFAIFAASLALPGEDAYTKGRVAERAGRYAEARGAYLECADLNGPLAPYAAVRAAGCQSGEDDYSGALASLSAILETHPDGPWVPMAKNEMALTLVLLDRHEEAAELFADVVDAEYDLWWLDRYRWHAAENDLSIDTRRDSGLQYFRDVVQSTPYPSLRLDAAHLLALSSRREDRIAAASGMLRSRAYADAGKIAASLAPMALKDPEFHAQWKNLSGRMLVATGNEERGMVLLQELSDEYPQSRWGRSAILFAIRLLVKDDDFQSAETLTQRLVLYHPESAEAGEARWELARGYIREEDTDHALGHLEALIESQPKHGRANSALLKTAELYLLMDRTDDAVLLYDRLVERRPQNGFISEGAYRAGDVLMDAGATEVAKARYRVAVENGMANYYGHKAQRRLELLEESRPRESMDFLRVAGKEPLLSPIPRADAAHPLDEASAHNDDARYQRLFYFGRHGFEEAEWEALALAGELFERLSGQPKGLSALADAGTAFSVMQVAYAHGWGDNEDGSQTVERLRVRFPRAYWAEVEAAGKETGIDPYIILSIARRESTYRPSLTSPSGARGVMQLMPSTAQWLAKVEEGVSEEQAANLEDPSNSIHLGAYYLKQMIERYDGNVVYALAAYNAGPDNCDKWIKQLGDEDVSSFIENIPFTETRNYVKRVLGFYAAYHSIYPRRL